MRDILFRGKRKDNGEWIEGYYAKAKDYLSDEEVHVIFPLDLTLFPRNKFCSYVEILPETVGAFTEIYDRNGNKIFEGDIIRYGYDEAHFVVCYKGGAFRMLNYADGCSSAIWPAYAWMILGNIHDNPELLEEEE